jgi:hypothetical protein
MAYRSGASRLIRGQAVPAWTDRNENTPVGNPVDRDFSGAITIMMAGSLLVFLRQNIGVRLLMRRRFVVLAALLIGVSYIQTPFDRSLTLFAVCVVILAFFHRARHMWRIKRGTPEWHSYDTGRSLLFGFLPLPRFFVQGVLEPAICGALGWWLAQRSNATFYLGWWLMLSSMNLSSLENTIRVARRESLFDLGDTFVESEHFARRAEAFTNRPGAGTGSARQQTHTDFRTRILWWLRMAAAFGQAKGGGQRADDHQRQQQQQDGEQRRWSDAAAGKMTEAQALEILELKASATEQEIRAAYNRIIQKVHPDLGGSNFFAKQLNAARDRLLGKGRSR